MRKIILATLFLAVTAICAAMYVSHIKQIPIQLSQPSLLTIKPGMSINKLAKELVSLGWLSRKIELKLVAKLNPELAQIKAGTYQVMPRFTILSLLSS